MLKIYKCCDEAALKSCWMTPDDKSPDDYMVVGDAADINAIYKAIRRNYSKRGEQGRVHPCSGNPCLSGGYFGISVVRDGCYWYAFVRDEHTIVDMLVKGNLQDA